MDDAVVQFMAITDQDATVAAGYLGMTEGDVMAAVNMFYENPDIANSFANSINPTSAAAAASSSMGAAAPARPQGSSRPIGREDSSGVIHIDSDDDDDDDFEIPDEEDDDADHNPAELHRIAQESDDAAMAQRLQQEMYGEGAMASDGVRAPIQRTTETLVAPSGYGGDQDDFHAYEQMRQRVARPNSKTDITTLQPVFGKDTDIFVTVRGNPFGQSIWDDDATASNPPSTFAQAAGGSTGEQASRAQRLADLFRPPYELMAHMSWDDARATGREDHKWILVNVQDMNDFNCQALNRDIWKDEAIAALVKESFIFLQYSRDDPRATEYSTFYFPPHAQENRDNFPHVAIIDPRTGEQVKVWSGIPFPSAQDFHAQLVEFLDRYSLAQNSKNPVSKQKAPQRSVDVGRMTEEEMLEMAMRNSLENANGGSGAVNVHDPDALTKSVELDKGKGKGKAVAATPEDEVMDDAPVAEEASAQAHSENSIFASIAADRPHSEPDNGPGVTRIQFRHANGRIIRRFALSDPLRRIYEWLKAEPLEGKTGVEFELKAMPQGNDLLEGLDKTVEAAGLKMATIMIEYIEP